MPNGECHFSLNFHGLDAEKNRLNLYDSSISNYGFARTLAIIGHYYITGDIISHAPKSKLELYLVAPEEGSFKQNIMAAAIRGIISAPFGMFASQLIDGWIPKPNPELQQIVNLLTEQNRLLRKQQGLAEEPESAERQSYRDVYRHLKEHHDEMQVLRSITSNSFKNVFRPIGRSALTVGLTHGPSEQPIGAVDPQVLARIESDEIDDNNTILSGIVNSFSRSSKTGTVFSNDLGRGFRFEYKGKEKLEREDIFSWSQYRGRPIRMTGRFVRFFDGNIKKLIVYRADRDYGED